MQGCRARRPARPCSVNMSTFEAPASYSSLLAMSGVSLGMPAGMPVLAICSLSLASCSSSIDAICLALTDFRRRRCPRRRSFLARRAGRRAWQHCGAAAATRASHTHTHARAAMSTPGGWFSALPVVMRAWGVSCVATTCAVGAGLVSPYRIALDWGLLLRRFQVSRARRRQPRRLCALWSRPDLTGCRGSACVNRLRTPPCAQSCRSRRRPRAQVRPHVQCGGTGKGEGVGACACSPRSLARASDAPRSLSLSLCASS